MYVEADNLGDARYVMDSYTHNELIRPPKKNDKRNFVMSSAKKPTWLYLLLS